MKSSDMENLDSQLLRRKAILDASKLTISMVVTMVLALVMKMYMPRAMGAEKLGVFFFAESFPVLFFALLPLGIGSYIQRHVPAQHEHAGDIFVPILAFEVAFSAFLLLMMWVALTVMNYALDAKILCMVMGFYTALLVAYNSILKPMFLALNRTTMIAKLDVVIKVILVGSVMISLWEGASVMVIAWCFLGAQTFGVSYLCLEAWRRGIVQLNLNVPLLKNIIFVSLPFFFASVFAQIYQSTDATFLSKMASNQEVGLYGAASRLQGVFLVLVPILQSALLPMMSRTFKVNGSQYEAFAIDIFRVLLALVFPLTIGLILLGQEAVFILYGEEFHAATLIVAHLAPVLALTYLNVYLSMHLTLISNGVGMALTMAGSVLVNVLLNFIFIPYGIEWYGVGGAGVAVASATMLSEIVCLLGLVRICKLRLLTPRMIWSLLAVFLPCFAGLFFADKILYLAFWERLAIMLIVVPAYAVAARIISWRDVRRLVGLVRHSKLNN